MTPPFSEDLISRAKAIRLAAFDVDGVMTNGHLTFDDEGREYKTFHVRDGLGFKLLQSAGIELAIITGRRSPIVELRARELGIEHIIQGSGNKLESCRQLLDRLELDWRQCAYMGDDLPDLALMKQCGMALTVPDAPELLRHCAHWIAPLGGGEGAVRHAAEMLIHARGQWADLVRKWQG